MSEEVKPKVHKLSIGQKLKLAACLIKLKESGDLEGKSYAEVAVLASAHLGIDVNANHVRNLAPQMDPPLQWARPTRNNLPNGGKVSAAALRAVAEQVAVLMTALDHPPTEEFERLLGSMREEQGGE